MLLKTFYKMLYNHRRRIFDDSANSEEAKLFCEVSLNLLILSQYGILPPNSGEDQKKRSSLHSGCISVQNFESRLYLKCQEGITCQKTEGARHISPPSVSNLRRCRPPATSKSTPVLTFNDAPCQQ